ncbi:MAG: tungstate ABC transporter substrate-binding protein WtpA [Syntrophobacteraceae bacterium]|nr:tungstate ABC transporter substrate-binding protein WtpA [Syntrophobacteraceae bacterium]
MKKTGFFKEIALMLLIGFVCAAFAAFPSLARAREKIIIFNAGSLSIPLKEMSEAFNKLYPNVEVLREAAGSRVCARKITDLKKPCDIMASADYSVIDNLLIPDHASWDIHFATNEMAIMYRPDSKHAKEINSANWYKILLEKGVQYGHSDPNADPCGYRTLLTWQLAEKYLKVPGLYKKLVANCPIENVRPKETDLIALLESGQLDYVFIYRSVCEQHHMPCVRLPDQINLGSPASADFYRQASLRISGKKPGEFVAVKGAPMVYGLTIPKDAPDRQWAVKYLAFVLGPQGRAIMEKNGQHAIYPAGVSGDPAQVPPELKPLVK